MKLFSFTLSVIVFFISLYFFALKISDIDTFNDIIYIMLLVILMAICIVGILINWNSVFKRNSRESVILFVANNFSKKKYKR